MRPRVAPVFSVFARWLDEPQPILRLELVRIFAPLAVLGFMSGRVAHADELLGTAGFHVPNLGVDDYRQPLYVAPLSNGTAWLVAAVLVLSGLCLSAGFRTRAAALVFAASLAFVALADRLAAFTVTKMSPTLMLALFFSPAGARFGVDAWLRRRRRPDAPLPVLVSSGSVRFFQAFLVVMYAATAWAKIHGDWLVRWDVLWTHVHDSYQTTFSWVLANGMPRPLWAVLQGATLALEAGAPVWFAWRRSRPIALVAAVIMHAMIGLMFGPVKWFALEMIALLVGSYAPEAWLDRAAAKLGARFG
ncbi:MAG TPA: HTTM domain-containing protein [Minicystis sp.]|nr:HTTM domain-containing protein [Minicystis sp.]